MRAHTALALSGATVFLAVPLSALMLRAGENRGDSVVIVDGAGKEIVLKKWKFSGGVRPLAWLSDEKAQKAEALDFREEKSTAYANGIVTLIPARTLKKIDYDHPKKTVRATVRTADGKDEILVGSMKFAGINKFNIDGDVDGASFTLQGGVKLQDGFLRAGIDSVRWPAPEANDEPTGRPAVITAQDKDMTRHQVRDLWPLYKTAKGQETVPFLVFQKTIKIETAKIVSMEHIPPKDKKAISHDYEVTLEDGAKQGMTLLEKIMIDEKPATLVGLVGKVRVGYKLFPAHTIAKLRFEPAKDKE